MWNFSAPSVRHFEKLGNTQHRNPRIKTNIESFQRNRFCLGDRFRFHLFFCNIHYAYLIFVKNKTVQTDIWNLKRAYFSRTKNPSRLSIKHERWDSVGRRGGGTRSNWQKVHVSVGPEAVQIDVCLCKCFAGMTRQCSHLAAPSKPKKLPFQNKEPKRQTGRSRWLLTFLPNANLKKKLRIPFGILVPRACCRLTLYPLRTSSGYLVRHHITTHARWFSTIEMEAWAMFLCSAVSPASRSWPNFWESSLIIIVLSAISSPFISTKGSWPFFERYFILWSTFWNKHSFQQTKKNSTDRLSRP